MCRRSVFRTLSAFALAFGLARSAISQDSHVPANKQDVSPPQRLVVFEAFMRAT